MLRSMPVEPIVRVRNVSKSLGGAGVLEDVSLDVYKGEVVCLVGPSGSGKSTLLRCINALVTVDRGSIEAAGHQVHALASNRDKIALRKDVAIVFQQYNLFPHKTALENVMLAPVHVLGEDPQDVERRARALLAKVWLQDKAAAYPGELSGGQQQRVAIARALAMRPKVMLLDEITAALDPEAVREVLRIVRDVAAEGMTCLVVTHELRFAREAADHVHFMNAGSIIEHAPPAQFFAQPMHERLKAFLAQAL
ncbi:MAG: amino acid ABC transporter ATP-binding protein [Burkholderiales bacterium]|nr:amino acid ABC transporter ATP-binding protein [Burkholderiales bacterium]